MDLGEKNYNHYFTKPVVYLNIYLILTNKCSSQPSTKKLLLMTKVITKKKKGLNQNAENKWLYGAHLQLMHHNTTLAPKAKGTTQKKEQKEYMIQKNKTLLWDCVSLKCQGSYTYKVSRSWLPTWARMATDMMTWKGELSWVPNSTHKTTGS